MKKLSVEQQIAVLRPTMGFAAQMHKWFLAGAALGVIASVIFWNPIPLIFSIFVAVVGFSEKRAGPNIVIAISAYDSETPSFGEVCIPSPAGILTIITMPHCANKATLIGNMSLSRRAGSQPLALALPGYGEPVSKEDLFLQSWKKES